MPKRKPVSSNKREERELRRRRARNQALIKWGGLGLLALLVAGGLIWAVTRPATAMGEGFTVTSRDHIPEGTDPGPYQSSPPVGGKHYPATYQPGFYDESDLETLPEYHEGYLLHNLEHGYIIFWYNCNADPDLDCEELKSTIRQVMDEAGTDELIAFPYEDQEEPLVLTSWDRMLRLDQLDTGQMHQFIRLYLNKSPEPAAR